MGDIPMRKWITFFMTVVCTGIFLCGCGSNMVDLSETTVLVEKSGKVTDAIVESFDKGYYNSDELKKMVEEEISSYGKLSGSSENAKLTEFKIEEGTAKVYIEFASAADYASFNGVSFFFGTISEAYDNGYDLDVTLKSSTSNETIGKDELMEMGKNHILIASEPIKIQTYSNILYSTANVDILDDKQARISDESEGLAYIILK